MKELKLLAVLYDVPEKPPRIKVGSWRKLRGLGGVYPRLSLCMLPDTDEIRDGLEKALSEIRKWGTAIALEVKPLSESDVSSLLSVLKSVKEREYREILEECDEFLSEVGENIEKGNLTQEEAEELAEFLEALKKWYERARSTDWLGMQARLKIEEKLKECEKALEEFTSLCLRNLTS